jgi:hypothetical protein
VGQRDVGGAVVGHHGVDLDAVAAVEGNGAAKEGGGCDRAFVVEDLGVGKPRGVVDADVHVFPTDQVAAYSASVGRAPALVLAHPVPDSLAGAALDTPELLDVNVQQLAGAGAFVALGRLEPESAELAQPDPRQDPRHRRLGHPEDLGDRRAGKAQPPQRRDRRDPRLRRAVVNMVGGRRAIQKPRLAFLAEAPNPFTGRPLADVGGRGRLGQRPPLIDHTPAEQAPLVQSERGVTVQLHPVSSLRLSGLSTSQPPRRPG